MEVKVDADELCELRKEASRADRYHADLVEISSRHNKLIATLGGNDPGSCETWFIARSEHKEFVVRTHKQICRLNDVIAFKDKQIADLGRLVITQDEQIADLNRRLNTRGNSDITLHPYVLRILAERDLLVARVSTTIDDLSRTIGRP